VRSHTLGQRGFDGRRSDARKGSAPTGVHRGRPAVLGCQQQYRHAVGGADRRQRAGFRHAHRIGLDVAACGHRPGAIARQRDRRRHDPGAVHLPHRRQRQIGRRLLRSRTEAAHEVGVLGPARRDQRAHERFRPPLRDGLPAGRAVLASQVSTTDETLQGHGRSAVPPATPAASREP
jgi:hypothetical protein